MYIYQIDRFLLQRQVKEAARHLKGRVLNVGSGPMERYVLPDMVTEYVRMDIAEGPNVDIVGRAEKIPVPDASFDAVLSTQVFEHVEHAEEAAREVARVLKKNGHLLVTVPQWNELHEEPYDYWRYTKYGLQTLFERNGFVLVDMQQRGGYYSNRVQMKMRFLMDKHGLHKRPLLGRIASRVFTLWGAFAIWRDARDGSVANRKHAIGWCAVFQRK